MHIQDVLPRDAIPPIDDPVFGTEYFGEDDEGVIVVETTPARAYPVRILSYNEIVTDVLEDGERPERETNFERRYRLDDCDPRIHFALNCGARSCPPIRAYEPGRIDKQLDLATRSYLDATVEYDPKTGIAHIPRVFLWFRGDFGGGSGIREFLRGHGAIPDDATPKLRHLSWDWSKATGKFVE